MGPAVEAQALKATDAEQKQNQLQHQQRYVEKGVMLEPFVHQVGGHCCVLRFGEQTICKPLIPREHQFYKSLPAAVRKFTPQYRGKANWSLCPCGSRGGFCRASFFGGVCSTVVFAPLCPPIVSRWLPEQLTAAFTTENLHQSPSSGTHYNEKTHSSLLGWRIPLPF